METITLTLNQEQVSIIAAGLNELPGRVCNPMLQLIDAQISEQMAQRHDDEQPVP